MNEELKELIITEVLLDKLIGQLELFGLLGEMNGYYTSSLEDLRSAVRKEIENVDI